MIENIELLNIDRRYENLRLRDKRREQVLLSSISEHGITDPLYSVSTEGSQHILLDGFKRCRCAEKLNISSVPVHSLDNSTVPGIFKFMRLTNTPGLNALEEASLVDELHKTHGLSTYEIGRRLERSVSWVSLRLGLLREMSDSIRKQIFSGHFPVRNYMYTLRNFTRVNNRSKKEVESFVKCVAGRQLSTRNIDLLADAYFKGSEVMRTQIQDGNIDWTLRHLKDVDSSRNIPANNLNEMESRVLSNLAILRSYIIKLNTGLSDHQLGNEDFFTRGRKSVKQLLNMLDNFKETLQDFYDTTGPKADDSHAVPDGQA